MLKKFITYALGLLVAIPVMAIEITNPLKANNPQELAGFIIKAVLGITGTVALIYFIVGGLMWMTAGGNMDKVKKGKDTLVWATLGLIIIFSAYSILNFFFTIPGLF